MMMIITRSSYANVLVSVLYKRYILSKPLVQRERMLSFRSVWPAGKMGTAAGTACFTRGAEIYSMHPCANQDWK